MSYLATTQILYFLKADAQSPKVSCGPADRSRRLPTIAVTQNPSRIPLHDVKTKVGNLVDHFTRQPNQYIRKRLRF